MSSRFRAGCALALGLAFLGLSNPASAQGDMASLTRDNDDDALQWLADANVGALKLESSGLQAAGDISAGVSQERWGIAAWGSGSAYELVTDERSIDTTRLEGTGEAWLMTGARDDTFRLVIEGNGGGVNYSSTVHDKTGTGTWQDQTSWLGRGSLLLGGLLRPDASFTAYLAVGGGVQFEWYDTLTATVAGAPIEDTQDLSFVGSGRLELRWLAAPEIVSLRIRSAATYFKLSRTHDFLGETQGAVQLTTTTTTFSQLEVTSRAFLDIDAASFYGFRPSVHGGLDYVRASGADQSVSTSIPVFGAGLLHPWM